jgi:hypothetical protein
MRRTHQGSRQRGDTETKRSRQRGDGEPTPGDTETKGSRQRGDTETKGTTTLGRCFTDTQRLDGWMCVLPKWFDVWGYTQSTQGAFTFHPPPRGMNSLPDAVMSSCIMPFLRTADVASVAKTNRFGARTRNYTTVLADLGIHWAQRYGYSLVELNEIRIDYVSIFRNSEALLGGLNEIRIDYVSIFRNFEALLSGTPLRCRYFWCHCYNNECNHTYFGFWDETNHPNLETMQKIHSIWNSTPHSMLQRELTLARQTNGLPRGTNPLWRAMQFRQYMLSMQRPLDTHTHIKNCNVVW